MRAQFSRIDGCGVLLLLLGSALVRPAAATAPEPAAKVLFKEGRELAQKGDYVAACPKFEQSLSLEVGVGTQFNLADCWERIGRTASAQALFLGGAASAKAAGQSEREQVLRERAAALEPRVPKLVVEVAGERAELSVKRGELPLSRDQWGRALAVDPGQYEIVAKAPGAKPWSKRVELDAGAGVVTVHVPELEPLEDSSDDAEPLAPSPGAPTSRPAVASASLPAGAQAGPPYTTLLLGTIGIGGVVVGSVMALRYVSANDDAKSICPTGQGCSAREIADHARLVDEATTARTWTYAGYGIGAFAMAGATALLLLNGHQEQPQRAWIALPAVHENGALGATMSGQF